MKTTENPRRAELARAADKLLRVIQRKDPSTPFATIAEAHAAMVGALQPLDVAAEVLDALKWILPLAEAYLKSAPSHPDNAKLESARMAIQKAEEK